MHGSLAPTMHMPCSDRVYAGIRKLGFDLYTEARCEIAQVRHDYNKMPVDISEYGITDSSVPGSVGAPATLSSADA